MENKEFARHLEDRKKTFAISIIRISSILPNTPEGRVIRKQITKSGTSIGVNYREANQARSKAQFFQTKSVLLKSETCGTEYWL